MRTENREKLKNQITEPKEGDVESQKAKVEEMAKYWKAGFGSYMAGITGGAEVYVLYPEDRSRALKRTEDLLSAVGGGV